jgi:transcriptional regulator with XRE-family HTH domain
MGTQLKNQLRLWRVRHGLSLEDVADLTGYSVAMISRAERGERTFSPLAKVAVARALDVRVRDLFDIEGQEGGEANDHQTHGDGAKPTSLSHP